MKIGAKKFEKKGNESKQPTMLSAYDLLETIGKGSYGKIIKARRKSDGQIVVVKKVALDRLTPQEQNDTLNEMKLMEQLDHPNIVKFYDAFLENQTVVIVMEFLEGGDLSRPVKLRAPTQDFLAEEVIWKYCAEIAVGLKYLHDRRIIHRDIKLSNMLVDTSVTGGRVKIGDFGFGKLMGAQQLAYSAVGTPLCSCISQGTLPHADDFSIKQHSHTQTNHPSWSPRADTTKRATSGHSAAFSTSSPRSRPRSTHRTTLPSERKSPPSRLPPCHRSTAATSQ